MHCFWFFIIEKPLMTLIAWPAQVNMYFFVINNYCLATQQVNLFVQKQCHKTKQKINIARTRLCMYCLKYADLVYNRMFFTFHFYMRNSCYQIITIKFQVRKWFYIQSTCTDLVYTILARPKVFLFSFWINCG